MNHDSEKVKRDRLDGDRPGTGQTMADADKIVLICRTNFWGFLQFILSTFLSTYFDADEMVLILGYFWISTWDPFLIKGQFDKSRRLGRDCSMRQ